MNKTIIVETRTTKIDADGIEKVDYTYTRSDLADFVEASDWAIKMSVKMGKPIAYGNFSPDYGRKGRSKMHITFKSDFDANVENDFDE